MLIKEFKYYRICNISKVTTLKQQMSNTFKNNSRFSVLCEDVEPNNTNNNNKKQQKNTKENKRFNITDSESN